MYGNDSAFPWSVGNWGHCGPEMREGVTKREFFAGLICACACANPEIEAFAEPVRIVADSVAIADELIRQLNEREDND